MYINKKGKNSTRGFWKYIGPCAEWLPEHIVESHVTPAVQSLHLVAHVFEQQLVLVQVHLQPATEQTEQELHPGRRDHALGEGERRN